MMGMEMMLKSLGINPDEIRQTIEGIATGLQNHNAALERIEANQMETLRLLRKLTGEQAPVIQHEAING